MLLLLRSSRNSIGYLLSAYIGALVMEVGEGVAYVRVGM
jgi:hypothetical protein